jgi:hypothetical protein
MFALSVVGIPNTVQDLSSQRLTHSHIDICVVIIASAL